MRTYYIALSILVFAQYSASSAFAAKPFTADVARQLTTESARRWEEERKKDVYEQIRGQADIGNYEKSFYYDTCDALAFLRKDGFVLQTIQSEKNSPLYCVVSWGKK